jgi:hypothetical protein
LIFRLSLIDVNHDGHLDLVAFFSVQETGLALGDTQACLEGGIDDEPFQGCDGIVVFQGCGGGGEAASILPALLWLRRRRKL